MGLSSVNPANGQVMKRFDPYGPDEIERRVRMAAEAAPMWRREPVATRARVLAAAAELLEAEKESWSRLMTLEMGKTLGGSIKEAEKCAAACRYYAERAGDFVAAERIDGPDHRVEIEPLGVVLAIMPWNFPFWQVVRFAAPALAAGNVALLKHASNVPQCALALEDLFRRAGAPAGVFQSLLVGAEAVEDLLADPRVAAATLTGSEGAGRAVASVAGQHLKKVVLELGGSDPFIVMPSADLDDAARTAVAARLVNNGQSCIAAKRFIVADAIYDRFAEVFLAALGAIRVGDPLEATTELGPLAMPAIRDHLDEQVRRTVSAGARLLLGGKPLPGPGNYYPPTVLVDIPVGSPAYSDELFGPVAALFRVRDFEQAVKLANDSGFGLGATAFTRDPDEINGFVRGLEAGSVFINQMVASDPRFPFGGIKRSGHGRELGPWGLREFTNLKTVRIWR